MRALIVAWREVRTYLQDKADLAFSLLLPIAIFALMYGAFGGQTLFHGTAHVVNEDQDGAYASRLLEQLDEIENIDVELLTRSEADVKLAKSDLLMVLYIPPEFSAKLASGESAQLIFNQRGNGGQEGQIVASLIRGIAGEIDREFQVQSQVKKALAGRDIPQDHIEGNVAKFLERERQYPLLEIREETLGASPDPVNQFLPGIVTMFVLFAITMSARAIVEERKKGTLERLLTTRLTIGQLFTGKFLANVLRGFVQIFILLTLAYIVFQLFTPLSFMETLIIALVFVTAVSALGLVIASVVRTEDQATWIAALLTMVMVMLGGTFSSASKGTVLYFLGKASLNTYANDALKTIIAQGGSLADVRLELLVMAVIITVALLISRILFRVIPGAR